MPVGYKESIDIMVIVLPSTRVFLRVDLRSPFQGQSEGTCKRVPISREVSTQLESFVSKYSERETYLKFSKLFFGSEYP